MEQRLFAKSGEKVSLLGFGIMRMPHPDKSAVIDRPLAQEMLDYALANGVNYIDTAYVYHEGDSEAFLGEALAKYPRGSYFLATKMLAESVNQPEDMERIFAEQLSKLKTDYIDFYLCHSVKKSSFARMKELGMFDFLEQKRAEGKIRFIGFSFHDTPEMLEEICNFRAWDFAQIQLNYMDWDYQQAGEKYRILERHGLPCVVMETLRGGALCDFGKELNQRFYALDPNASVASYALRYVASLPNVLTALSGMSTLEQVKDNIKTLSPRKPLSEPERAVMTSVLAEYQKRHFVPCTRCNYCVQCPKGVDIPQMIYYFNQYNISKNNVEFHIRYETTPEEGRAENCVGCGLCETLCPQKIKIPALMEEIAALKSELSRSRFD